MTMTKPGLIDELSAVSGRTKKESETVVETIFTQITQALVAGDKVELRGFGSFLVRQRNARRGWNSKTSSRVDIPRTRVPSFRVDKQSRERVNGERATRTPGGPQRDARSHMVRRMGR